MSEWKSASPTWKYSKEFSCAIPTIATRDHFFTVPLVHSHLPRAEESLTPFLSKDEASSFIDPKCTIQVFAREVILREHVSTYEKEQSAIYDKNEDLPSYLVFLQGGPGFPSPRPLAEGLPAWMKTALKHFRLILLDQRGTGRSTPLTFQTLKNFSPSQQAFFLSNFRADAIVADCEIVRSRLLNYSTEENSTKPCKWCLMGQSYGGFIITHYFTVAPDAIQQAYFFGGLPITDLPSQNFVEMLVEEGKRVGCLVDSTPEIPLSSFSMAEVLYLHTFLRVIKRNKLYYEKYPEDVLAIWKIVRYLQQEKVILPSGGRLTPQRFQLRGISFGFVGGFDALHHSVQEAWVTPLMPPQTKEESKEELDFSFVKNIDSLQRYETNPIYVLLHESIYCDGGAPSLWAAERICNRFFKHLFVAPLEELGKRGGAYPDVPFYFFGEHVFSWMLNDDTFAGLRTMKEAGELLAKHSWPNSLQYEQLSTSKKSSAAKCAAAIYYDDLYVERYWSERTAEKLPSMKYWVTNEFDHGGLHSNGEAILEKLLNLVNGKTEMR